MQPWHISHRADPLACDVADRHYTRQKPGSSQFVPPGRCLVLRTHDYGALWVTSWPFAEYVKHEWAGAWVCSLFRNESREFLSSKLIHAAVAATRWYYGEPPDLGMITFVNKREVRGKKHFGACYRHARFEEVGYTKGGTLALQLTPDKMPPATAPVGSQQLLFQAA